MVFPKRVFKCFAPTLLLCLVTRVGGSAVVFPGGSGSPRQSAPRTVSPSFNETEMACFSQKKVLYSDGECYNLLFRGPCQRGEWLVLTDSPAGTGNNKRSAVCQVQQCTKPLQVYWPEDNLCHRSSEKDTLCPYQGNDLITNSYGEGDCGCIPNHVRYEQDVVNVRSANYQGICYHMYTMGPCRGSNNLQPKLIPQFGIVGQCLPDPCHQQNAQNRNSTFAIVAPNGPCVKLGTEGAPCGVNQTFNIHPLTKTARCFKPVTTFSPNTLYDGMDERCGGNMNALTKECRDELIVATNSLDVVVDMSGKPRRSRQRSAS